MKKISMAILTCMVGITAARADLMIAADEEQGGFVKQKGNVVAVHQVKDMRDDTNVVVQGHIIEHLDDDNYLFEDGTGSITVEIDKKDWRGQTVSPTDTVKLYGEVDRGFMKTKIDVDYVDKVQ